MSDFRESVKQIVQTADSPADLIQEVVDLIDETEPTPWSDDMPADGLRAAYENYHAQVHRLERLLADVRLVAGFIAERAADVIKLGGEI